MNSAQGAKEAENDLARQTYKFLVDQEEKHYQLLENKLAYLSQNQTWWDSEEYPFFIG